MINRCVKNDFKHFDQATLNQLLIESEWEFLKKKKFNFSLAK